MFPSVRAMFAGIVDYAGMFPPAQLPLEQAIRNYARYRTEPESWMMGRFVCPAARLAELSAYVEELFREGTGLKVSALGSDYDTLGELQMRLEADLQALQTFNERHGGAALVYTLEVRL